MDRKYGEFVGVDSLHYAIVTKDDADGYVADTPEYLAPAAEIAAETETNNTPTYYDNKPGNNYVSEGVTTLTITVSGIPGKLAAKLLGKDFDAVSGRVMDGGIPNPPDVALGYRAGIGKSDYRYSWYLKGTFSGGAEEAATKAADVDIRTYELTFTAVVTTKEWTINGESKGLKKISGDTTETAFSPTGWFSQVQTPDTGSAPSAIALSSIVPTDGATNVDVDDAIVLTFNNAIASDAVILIVSTDGTVVAASKSWNAAGKALTLTPTSALDTSTKYIVSIAGVVDVYGQALAAVAKDFTTAAS